MAPWVHSHLTMGKERALCCIANPLPDEPLDIQEFWNGDRVKDARVKMMAGTAPYESCSICLDGGFSSIPPWNRFEKYRHMEEELLSLTSPDGHFSRKPIDFDFRLDNTCNLKCRMCNEDASSQIESLWKKILPADDPRLLKVEEQRTIQKSQVLPEMKEALERGEMKRVYWATGEAFLQQSHWDFIKEIKAKGLAGDMTIDYHSNLSYPPKLFEKYLSELESFKQVNFYGSLDGFKGIGEFIRDGMRWDFFDENVKTLTSGKYTNIDLDYLQMTLTIPALLNFKDVHKYIDTLNRDVVIGIAFNKGVSRLFSPLDLPLKTRKSLVYKVLEELPPHSPYKSYFKDLDIETPPTLDSKGYYDLFIENHQLDKVAKRRSLLSFYNDYRETREWVHEIFKEAFDGDNKGIHLIYDKENFLFLLELKEEFPNMVPPLHFTGAYPTSFHRALTEKADHFSVMETLLSKKTTLKVEVTPTSLIEPLFQNIIKKGWIKQKTIQKIDQFLLRYFPHLALQAKISFY